MITFNPAPKPNHQRRKPKRGNLTKITSTVRKEVLRRSDRKCERCGTQSAYCFEMAHLHSAGQGGSGNDPANIVLLCGPSTNSGTCHNWCDYTAEGREWRMQKREELKKLYEEKEQNTPN